MRKFRPALKLTRTLAEPGGIDTSRAITQAQRGLDSVRAYCLTAIDEKIESIALLAAGQDANHAAEIYDLANQIFGEAGAFGLLELSEAAHSLCSLLSCANGARSAAAISVHVNALRRLRRADIGADMDARSAVLTGLRAVTARFAS